jgi:hypothetical protein
MDIRPCPRCSKLLPSGASFCRRCGVAMRPPNSPGAVERAARDPGRGRWGSLVTASATATFAGVLALLAVSGPRVSQVCINDPPPNPLLTSDNDLPAALVGDALRRLDASGTTAGHASAPSARSRAPAAPARRRAERTIATPPSDSRAPRIVALGGPRAALGHKLAIRGSGLLHTTRVLFLGADGTRSDARFGALDDGRILAIVPDLGPLEQDAAVAVVAPAGVAVTLPRDAAGVGRSQDTAAPLPRGHACVVAAGGAFDGLNASVVFLDGGASARLTSPGATLFARRGARLRPGPGEPLVFCESGVLDRSGDVAGDFVEVDAVNPCFVDALFHYAGWPAGH